MVWIEFLLSAVLIIYSGISLTIFADQLSDVLNLGKLWLGIILLGLVTSLPEAVTSGVAVLQLNADNLATGNILGSNNFNPMLIVIMDLIYRQGSITNDIKLQRSHTVSAVFAMILGSIVLAELIFGSAPSLGSLSWGGVLIVIFYIYGMKKLTTIETQVVDHQKDTTSLQKRSKPSLSKIWTNLIFSSILVVIGAIWLANSADTIATQTGLGRTFVGSIFLALVTSLPEMVVSISALKLGSVDLAIGNVYGSNMSNVFILWLCSLMKGHKPILMDVSNTHILTAFSSILLVAISIKGIMSKGKKVYGRLSWDTMLMAIIFMTTTIALYLLR